MTSPVDAPRKKLLVILGAGSSMVCHLPGVRDIDYLMKCWSTELGVEPVFPHGAGRGIFNDVWGMLNEYYHNHPVQRGFLVNFERVLAQMTELSQFLTPAPFGNPLRMAVKDGALTDKFTWSADHGPYFDRLLILDQQSFLLSRLAAHMRRHSASVDQDSESFRSYQEFFAYLRREFDLGVYNLNYDDLAVRALPEAFTGFDDGCFDAEEVTRRASWDFVYHLHGSVHYSFTGSPASHEIKWHDDLNGEFLDCHPVRHRVATEYKPILQTTLVAGGFKLDQLLANPFQCFQASLVRHVHEADACLIIGYGFGDHHVNRALLNRFNASHPSRRGRPPVVVLDRKRDGWRLGLNESNEYWAQSLTHAMDVRFFGASEKRTRNTLVTRMRENGHFEIDLSEHVAAWLGGLLEARPHLAEIVSWLRR